MKQFNINIFKSKILKISLSIFALPIILFIPFVTSCSNSNYVDKNINTKINPMSITLSLADFPTTNDIDGFYSKIDLYKQRIISSGILNNKSNQYTDFLNINNLCIPYSSISLNNDRSYSFTLFLNQFFYQGQIVVKAPTTFINNQNKYSVTLSKVDFDQINTMDNLQLSNYLLSFFKTNNLIQSYPGIIEQSDINVTGKQMVGTDLHVSFNLRRNYNYTTNGDVEMVIIFKYLTNAYKKITTYNNNDNLKQTNTYSSNNECYTNIRVYFK